MQQLDRTNNFDLLRLLAATQVMLYHSREHFQLQAYPWLLAALDSLRHVPGVPIFFMISGFLIFWSYERNQHQLTRYIRNRILRIYPALWVCFFITVGILFAFGILHPNSFLRKDIWAWVVTQVSFLQFYTPTPLRSFGTGTPNGVLWTICIELQFYVFVPLLGALIAKRTRAFGSWVLVACIAVSLAANVWIATLPREPILAKLLRVQLLPYLFYFLLGTLAYRHFGQIRRLLEGKFLIWLAVYFSYFLLFSTWLGWYSPSYWVSPLSLVASVLLLITALSFAYTWKSLSQTYLRHQDLSYGVYIYHGILLNVMVHSRMMSTRTHLVLFWLASYGLAALSWWFVEKPALRRKQTSPPHQPTPTPLPAKE